MRPPYHPNQFHLTLLQVPFDGESLKPILENPETATVKPWALSMFPRCAHVGMPLYGARGTPDGADNSCLEVERTDFTWMGYTMRTDRYRYTEWVGWDGDTLSPIWSALKAAELYDHLNDTAAWTDADKYENVNLVKTADPAVVAGLSSQLHAAFGFPATATIPFLPSESPLSASLESLSSSSSDSARGFDGAP